MNFINFTSGELDIFVVNEQLIVNWLSRLSILIYAINKFENGKYNQLLLVKNFALSVNLIDNLIGFKFNFVKFTWSD